jgi:hypothetical protein
MTGEFVKDRTFNMEKTLERKVILVGRLGQIGTPKHKLGNKEGIPSRYRMASPEELQEMAEAAARKLLLPTDLKATGCIDGRKKLRNMDGSAPEVRLRRVGGSASNLGVALNAGAAFIDTLDPASPLESQIDAIDAHVMDLTGFERSAHTGGCGGAGGEVEDNEMINSDPAILAATKAFLEIPEVRAYLLEGHEADFEDSESGETLPLFDDTLAEEVREAAGKTAQFLKAKGWDGKKYVDGVVDDNPRGVEDLEVDHDDHKYHGHKEGSILVVLGDETYAEDDDFVWNLKASKMVAEALAVGHGRDGYVRAIIAEIAKHMATSSRLASIDTPVAIISR